MVVITLSMVVRRLLFFCSFLNWLTIAPSIWYLDDKFLAVLFSEDSRKQVIDIQEEDKILKDKKKVGTNY